MPRVLALAAAVALFVRLLVPAGFMPQVAHGHVTIVSCPGVMPAAVHGGGHHAPAHDGFERPCAFAAVAAAATVLAVAVLLAPPLAARVGPVSRRRAPPPAGATRRWRPPLRAPPMILPVR